jgi:hypothetical protein
MAKQIEEPSDEMVDMVEWGKFLNRTTRQSGGFICLEITNINNTGKPQIVAGSRFEINAAVYEADKNEDIPGQCTGYGKVYVYAGADTKGDNCSFFFDHNPPTWSAAKGGWYRGNNRALVKFYYMQYGNQYNNKVILDSYNAMWCNNRTQDIPQDGGLQIVEIQSPNVESGFVLGPGAYRYVIMGGRGGTGGGGGGPGAFGETKRGEFKLTANQSFCFLLGGDGQNGGQGNTNCGHGGGCSGGMSYIRSDHDLTENNVFSVRKVVSEFIFLDCAIGGSGGGGNAGDSSGGYGGGGGGGGGYGDADNGPLPGSGAGGKSGHGGNGGAGTSGTAKGGGGGGGSGLAGGSGGAGAHVGGNNYSGVTSANNGAAGGAYGGSGGSGADGIYISGNNAAKSGNGGAGGKSQKLSDGISSFRNAYQGGGGGGGYSGTNTYGGAGGSGLLSTSSGHVRLYMLWLE